jgi:hypothetical protein
MRKKQHKYKYIGQMKQVQRKEVFPEEWLAQHVKRAMDSVAPLIRSEKLSPVQGLILTFMIMNFNIIGKETRVNAHETYEGILIILELWQIGAFQPSPHYPHTREQVVADLEKEEPHLPPVQPDSYWSLATIPANLGHLVHLQNELPPFTERLKTGV